jgi:hypothetical protein
MHVLQSTLLIGVPLPAQFNIRVRCVILLSADGDVLAIGHFAVKP